jgi:hypothetical protein
VVSAPPEHPNTYTVVLPPEWIRVSLTGGSDQAVKDITARMFRHLPRDGFFEERRSLEALVTETVRNARANNGLDLFLPVEQMQGRSLAASFVVGGVLLKEDLDELETLALVGDLAAGGSVVDLGGVPGARTERAEPGDPASGMDIATRRVDYMVPIPGQTRRWLSITFSTPGGGDPADQVADALVELFDAIMTTFRWRQR